MLSRKLISLGAILIAVWWLFAPPTVTAKEETAEPAGNAQGVIPRELIDQSPFAFSLPKRHGNRQPISFTDLVYEHNVVIMLWVTDCPLCKLEVRHMNKLVDWAEKHPDANLLVVSVNFDLQGSRRLEEEKWEEAMKPRFDVYFDPMARHFDLALWQLEEHGVPVVFFFAQGGFPLRFVSGFSSDLVSFAEKEFGRKPQPIPTPETTPEA